MLQAGDFGQLIHALQRPQALVELSLVLAVAMALAGWRLLRGPTLPDRVLALDALYVDALALLVRWGLHALGHPVALFKLMVPLLVALVVIRLTVRVLHQAFPNSGLMRVVERSVSWLAWVAMALWVTGVLPSALDYLDTITWKMGGTQMSVSYTHLTLPTSDLV